MRGRILSHIGPFSKLESITIEKTSFDMMIGFVDRVKELVKDRVDPTLRITFHSCAADIRPIFEELCQVLSPELVTCIMFTPE
jgi:hypothetical protein